jgi:hypothetical protein
MPRVRCALITLWLCGLVLSAQAPKPGKVTVTLINSVTLAPVPGAKLILNPPRGAAPYIAEAGSDGKAELNGVRPDDFVWSIGMPTGFTIAAQSSTRITVPAGGTVQLGTVTLIPPGAVQGTVRDDMRAPVAGAQIDIVTVSGFIGELSLIPKGYGTTDVEGRYRIDNVAPGPALVRISAPPQAGQGTFQTTYYPNADMAQISARLHVPPGKDLEGIDFEVRRIAGFHVRGSVAPLSKTTGKQLVWLYPCGSGPRDVSAIGSSATLQPDGSFDFDGTPPGRYCAVYRGTDELRPGQTTSFAATPVTVIDRDVDGVQLTPSAPKSMRGVIEVEPGAQVRMPTQVYLFSAISYSLPPLQAKVDAATGRFEFSGVLAARYTWRASSAGGFVRSVRLGTRDVTTGAFEYFGDSESLTIRIAAARGELRGKITSGAVSGQQKYTITAAPTGAFAARRDLSTTTSTLENGEFQIHGLAPGTYRVYAWESPDYGWIDVPEFLSRFVTNTVEVRDGQVADVQVRLISTTEVQLVQSTF